jgi:hypothetical protein
MNVLPAILIAAAFIGWLGWMFYTAPMGFEDNDGFHLGELDE